jgi:methylated-DNA-[protein]-cysteine S-methyltransferase
MSRMEQTTSTPQLKYAQMTSPIGPLTLVTTNRGLCAIEFGTFEQNNEKLKRWVNRWIGAYPLEQDQEALQPVREQLEQYFLGIRRDFDLVFDLYGTPFQQLVWKALTEITYGATASYKNIAEAIDSPKAVRAVGGANNRNPLPVVIPCHRVIGASGELVGYGGGLEIKIILLELEGNLGIVK